jgi:Mce-associated membrane protein
MPTTRDQRMLRLVKGTDAAAPRPRRAIVRRLPRAEDDPVALLARLDEEPVSDKAPPNRRRRLPLIGAAVALALALAAAVVSGYQWYQDRALDEARQQALAAAKQTSVNFVSVSASSVDRDLQRIVAGATGDFKDEFVRGQAQVRTAIVENKVESRGTVLRAGLVSGDRRSAVVLVAVDATVKNVKAPDGRASHYRIQVDVTRDGESGAWLVSKLQFVG